MTTLFSPLPVLIALASLCAACGASGLPVASADAAVGTAADASPPAPDAMPPPADAIPPTADAIPPTADTSDDVTADVPAAMDPGADAFPGGTGDATAAPPVVKFCHQLRRTNAEIDLIFEVGDPPAVRLLVRTNTCAPARNEPCASVPAGRQPLRVVEGDRTLATSFFIFQEGREYGFQPVVDATGRVVVMSAVLDAGTCPTVGLPPPDAGAAHD
jgi:hypothetical protein